MPPDLYKNEHRTIKTITVTAIFAR